MKIILLILCTLISVAAFSQNGRLSGDSLILNSGQYFIKGSSISIDKGSKSDGGYVSLFVKPQKTFGGVVLPVPLTAGWSGYKMKITGFRTIGNETTGRKFYLELSTGGKKSMYWCDPQLAIETKEIIEP